MRLEIEITPNYGQFFNPDEKVWVSFEFKDRDDPGTLIAARLKEGIILKKDQKFVYKKLQEKRGSRDYYLDCAAGKNCFFLFCHHRGVYKKLLDDSDPELLYKCVSTSSTHGINLRSSKDRQLLMLNKEDKQFFTMVLDRDRVVGRFDHKFESRKTGSRKPSQAYGQDFIFFGENTLILLFSHIGCRKQSLGVVKYRAENRKVLVKNKLAFEAGKKVKTIRACPRDRYLSCFCQKTEIDKNFKARELSLIEVYELAPRLDSLKLVASTRIVIDPTMMRISANIVDYIGVGGRYGVILSAYPSQDGNSHFLRFFLALFDTIEKRIVVVVEDGEIANQQFNFNGIIKRCQKKLFLMSGNFDFIQLGLTQKEEKTAEITELEC